MGKITLEDKMRMQTLREQGYGAAAICSMYLDRGWNVRSVHAICVRVDKRGSVMERKTGSGRPVSTKTAENIATHTARSAQEWLSRHCPDFIKKDDWPPNSPDLNPLDYYAWGAMLQMYHKCPTKPTTVAELKTVLEKIWEDLPQKSMNKAVLSFRKRLQSCVQKQGGHFEYAN
jgi:hypothetical protein